MPLAADNLVGYMQAEFAKASRLRVWLFALQLTAALPAAVAVLIPDHYGDALYWLAFFGAALLQLVQKRLDRGDVRKPVPALGVDAQLAGGLRAAQHEQAQQHG